MDSRGTGQSPGVFDPVSAIETNDIYDAIEWLADQSWSNGHVGMSGISYMAVNQWNVASLGPPSLKAIIPWEGFSDQYRDGIYNGGLMSYPFLTGWYNGVVYDAILRHYDVNDRAAFDNAWLPNIMLQGVDGPFWDIRRPDWDNFSVPVFSAANWSGWGGAGHLKGNTDGYKWAASKHKKLEIHTGGHQDEFYSERGHEAQLRFYDYWLKGEDNGLMDEPPVKLAIRRSVADRFDFFWRDEDEWPIARTEYTRFYLGSDNGELSRSEPRSASQVQYNAPDGAAVFVSKPFAEETEVTGEVLAQLWASSSITDMNVHASLYVIPPEGKEALLTKGRLRAAMRRLDEEKSTISQPYHRFDRVELLEPDEIVPLTVEIWPTSMVFQKGSQVKLKLSASDGATRSSGRQEPPAEHTIYLGGNHASYLQLPVVPPKQ